MSKSARRIVRNPITGEEVDYQKETINNNAARGINKENVTLNQRPTTSSQQQQQVKPVEQQQQQKHSDGVPMLNFDGFVNDSDRIKHKQTSQANPIISTQQIVQSARPKSSYRHGYDQMAMKSPIMNYQKELEDKNDSPLKSQLEAPRREKVQPKKETFHIERIEDLEKLWSGGVEQGLKHEFDTSRKTENVDKNRPLKEQLVLDTVLTDQLSRFVLSEPEQDQRPSSSRKMHNTVIHTKNSINENILSRRIKFTCRLRTRDGKNALRELFGILFLYDGSLTVYEFRQLCGAYFTGIGSGNGSKKANALPFISRKVYKHAYGSRKGKAIDIFDLFKGAVLYIPMQSIEEPNGDFYEIEVTDIDEVEKEKLISSHINDSTDATRNILKDRERMRQPYTESELNDRKVVKSIQSFFHEQIETRAIKVYTAFGRKLNKLTEKMNGLIDMEHFHMALNEFSLQIHEDDLKVIWSVLDTENFGYLNYYTLLRTCLGEMSPIRHAYFRELMHKLDTQKSGYVQLTDVHKFYRAKQHPKVKSGDISEQDYFEQLLTYFASVKTQDTDYYHASVQTNINSPLISYEQFENYYNGLSLIVESDSAFLNILKNSWSIL